MNQDDNSNKIGVVAATLMVAGNMMGSGVFMLPANLAAIGGVAVFGWIVTCIGAIALALTFAKLSSIDPAAGGPYAYTRQAFGDYMGYQTNLVYWLANVVGNVGLAVAGLGYLTTFFPSLKDPLIMALAQIGVIWFFTYANILGPNIVGRIQGMTTTVALLPIVGMAVFGWFWFSHDTYMAGWNVTGESNLTALGMTLNFTLWAFIGVESASVSTAVVKDPARNVPIATVVGVLLAAVCYILSSSAIMGIIPNKELIASSAPFSDAVSMALGPVAGNIVALCAAVGCLGSLGGWTLLVGQTVLCAPFAYLSVLPKLKQMDPNLYEAALDLGCNHRQALWRVIVREIMPGITSGFMLSVTLSLDDYFITTYTKPAVFDTISTYVVNATKGARTEIKTALWALSAVIFLVVVLVVIGMNMKAGRKQKR
mgnify:CR=1 FL=1